MLKPHRTSSVIGFFLALLLGGCASGVPAMLDGPKPFVSWAKWLKRDADTLSISVSPRQLSAGASEGRRTALQMTGKIVTDGARRKGQMVFRRDFLIEVDIPTQPARPVKSIMLSRGGGGIAPGDQRAGELRVVTPGSGPDVTVPLFRNGNNPSWLTGTLPH